MLKNEDFKCFYSKRFELYEENGILMWGHRVFIPESLRQNLLEQTHKTHMGIVKTKSLLRSYVWWPRMDEQIEDLVKSCVQCLMILPNPRREPVIPWEIQKKAWERIHLDFGGPLRNKHYLIVIDALSKWIEVFYTSSPTSNFVIKCLKSLCSRFGFPEICVSDNTVLSSHHKSLLSFAIDSTLNAF